MVRTLRIAAAQTPEFRGDVDAALRCLVDVAARAEADGVALLCFPEGFLQGYLTDAEAAADHALDLATPEFAAILARFPQDGPAIALGLIERDGDRLFNSAIVVRHRALLGRYRKAHLRRSEACFFAGHEAALFDVEGLRFGIVICNDANFPDTTRAIAEAGGTLVLCLANNMLPQPAAVEWQDAHNAIRAERCRESGLWMLSADVTGMRGDLLALGPTAVLNPKGDVVMQLPPGAPGLLLFDIPLG